MAKLNLKEGEYFGNKSKTTGNSLINLCIMEYDPFDTIDKHDHENNYLSMLIGGNYSCHNIKPGFVLFKPSSYTHQDKFITKFLENYE